jgi:hypothetical protein
MFLDGEIFEFPKFFFLLKVLLNLNGKAIVCHTPPCFFLLTPWMANFDHAFAIYFNSFFNINFFCPWLYAWYLICHHFFNWAQNVRLNLQKTCNFETRNSKFWRVAISHFSFKCYFEKPKHQALSLHWVQFFNFRCLTWLRGRN